MQPHSAPAPSSLCWIEITDIKIFLHLGVSPEEGKIGQNITLDLFLKIPFENTADKLENTVDYGEVIALIKDKIRQLDRVQLLEYLAEYILEQIQLHFAKILAAKVKITKGYVPLADFTGRVSIVAEKEFSA